MRASPRFSSVFSTQFLLKYWALSTLPAGYIKLNKHKSSTCSTRIEKAPAAESHSLSRGGFTVSACPHTASAKKRGGENATPSQCRRQAPVRHPQPQTPHQNQYAPGRPAGSSRHPTRQTHQTDPGSRHRYHHRKYRPGTRRQRNHQSNPQRSPSRSHHRRHQKHQPDRTAQHQAVRSQAG